MTLRDELERVIEAGSAFDVWEFIDTHGPALLEALVDAERYKRLEDAYCGVHFHPEDESGLDLGKRGVVLLFLLPEETRVGVSLNDTIDRARGGGEKGNG